MVFSRLTDKIRGDSRKTPAVLPSIAMLAPAVAGITLAVPDAPKPPLIGKTVVSNPRSLSSPLPSPSSELSVRPPAAAASSPSHDVDPWSRAYNIVQDRESELMADYKKLLGSPQDDDTASSNVSSSKFIESIVMRLLADREKKQWRVPLLGTDIKIREHAERLVKFMLWSEHIVKDALSTQPYAALAWSGVSMVLPLLQGNIAQIDAMLKGFHSISEIQVYWEICERDFLKPSHRHHYQALLDSLAVLYSHVIEYQARVVCHLSKAQISRALRNMIGENDWTGAEAHIQDLSRKCSNLIAHEKEREVREKWELQLQDIQQSRVILEDIRQVLEEGGRQMQKNYEEQIEGDLLQSLASNYESHKGFNAQRENRTCTWFFEDERFCEWRDSNTPSLLWVSAGPGCGKSVLSRALVDEQRLSTNITTSIVCYFFFKDGDMDRMYSYNALSAILHQLFIRDPTNRLIKNALPSHKNFGKKLTKNFVELWRILLNCAKSSDSGEIVCILDALDECNAVGRQELIHCLKNFYSSQVNNTSSSRLKLKFLITSRPYDDLEASFRELSGAATYLRLDGDEMSARISQDINWVIEARMSDFAGGFKPEDRERIRHWLESMEHRTYLWLHLALDSIKQNPCKFARVKDVERLLSKLPPRLPEAYEEILSRSKDERQTEILLRLILAAERPLDLNEANIALTLALQEERFTRKEELDLELWPSQDFREVVRNLCGLFVSVYDSKLFLIHQTAREFLLDPKRQGKWQGRLTMPKSHSAMSSACLQYLLLEDLQGLKPWALALIIGKSRADQENAFLRYAARYWPLHYITQEDASAVESRRDARALCEVTGQAMVWGPMYFNILTSWSSWSDLELASYLGLKLVVEDILTEERVAVNALLTKPDSTVPSHVSGRGRKKVIEMLLNKGVDANANNTQPSTTSLQLASEGGHRGVVEMLLDKGADINARDSHGKTALHWASQEGHKDVVEVLVTRGAEVDARDCDKKTAFQLALERDHEEVAEILLNHRAQTSSEDLGGSRLNPHRSREHHDLSLRFFRSPAPEFA